MPHPTTAGREVKLTVLERDGHLHRIKQRDASPVVWRQPFPHHIQEALVSFSNPHGTINNSELELASAFLQDEAAAQCFDVREKTSKKGTDNLSTLYWQRSGSVTTTSPTATLLRQQALHQRYHRYVALNDYEPGILNKMADNASRYFHLNDEAFLTLFNSQYPQSQPWRLFQLHPKIVSSTISALQTKTSPMALFLHAPNRPLPTGVSGKPSAMRSTWILPYKTLPTPSLSSKSLPGDFAQEKSTLRGDAFAAEQWRVP
jgi:hypothetical protein